MVLLYVNGCVFTAPGSINFFKNLIKFNPFHCIQNNLTQTQDSSGEGEEAGEQKNHTGWSNQFKTLHCKKERKRN